MLWIYLCRVFFTKKIHPQKVDSLITGTGLQYAEAGVEAQGLRPVETMLSKHQQWQTTPMTSWCTSVFLVQSQAMKSCCCECHVFVLGAKTHAAWLLLFSSWWRSLHRFRASFLWPCVMRSWTTGSGACANIVGWFSGGCRFDTVGWVLPPSKSDFHVISSHILTISEATGMAKR